MNDVSILDAIEFIDENIIEEADTYTVRRKKNFRLMWGAVAACLCLAVAVVSITLLSHKDNSPNITTGAVAGSGMYELARSMVEVRVRVDIINEWGFIGTIEVGVESDNSIFKEGEKVSVVYEDNVTVIQKDGSIFAYNDKEPNADKSDLAVGDSVWVGFQAYEYAEGNGIYNDIFANRIASTSSSEAQTGIAVAGVGVYIPPVEIPESREGFMYDMLGMVVYQGGIYTQSYNYYGNEVSKIDSLLGEYLGYATGTIDEWATQDDLAVVEFASSKEFASSIEGEIYEVIGYDTGFRICVRWEYEDGGVQLEFLDRLNDITLITGEDLFETRLNLRNRIANIQWQSHEDWDYAGGNLHDADIDSALWEEFLREVDAGYFVNTWDENMFSDPTAAKKTIYDTEKQAHIILTMEDGTTIQLRLIEGGYVGYDALGWYFVHIPGEVFDAVFDAMGGNS